MNKKELLLRGGSSDRVGGLGLESALQKAQHNHLQKRQEKIRLLHNQFDIQQETSRKDQSSLNFVDLINRMQTENQQKSAALARAQHRKAPDDSMAESQCSARSYGPSGTYRSTLEHKDVYSGLSQFQYRSSRHDWHSSTYKYPEDDLVHRLDSLKKQLECTQQNQQLEMQKQQQVKHTLQEVHQDVLTGKERNKQLQTYSQMHASQQNSLQLVAQQALREQGHSQQNLISVRKQVDQVTRAEHQHLQDTHFRQQRHHLQMQQMEHQASDIMVQIEEKKRQKNTQIKEIQSLDQEKEALHKLYQGDSLQMYLCSLRVLREFMVGGNVALSKPMAQSPPLTLPTACDSESETVLGEVKTFLRKHPLQDMVAGLVKRYSQHRQSERTLKRDYLALVKEKEEKQAQMESLEQECTLLSLEAAHGEPTKDSLMAMHFERREQSAHMLGQQNQSQTEFMFFITVSLVNQLLRLAYMIKKVFQEEGQAQTEEQKQILLLAKSAIRQHSRILEAQHLQLSKHHGSSKRAYQTQMQKHINHTLNHSITMSFLQNSLVHLDLDVPDQVVSQLLDLIQQDNVLSIGLTQQMVVDYLTSLQAHINTSPTTMLEHTQQMRMQCVEAIAHQVEQVLDQYQKVVVGLRALQGNSTMSSRNKLGVSWEGLGQNNPFIGAEHSRAADKYIRTQEDHAEEDVQEYSIRLDQMKQQVHDTMNAHRQKIADQLRVQQEDITVQEHIIRQQESIRKLGIVRNPVLHSEQKKASQNNRNLRNLEVCMRRPTHTASHLQALRQNLSRHKMSLQNKQLHCSARHSTARNTPSTPNSALLSNTQRLNSIYGQSIQSLKKQFTNQPLSRRIQTRE